MSEDCETPYVVDSRKRLVYSDGELNKEHMNEQVDRLTSRHIAKCLDQLGNTIVPAQMSSIKRSFRFLADDIKTQVVNGEQHDNTSQDIDGNR